MQLKVKLPRHVAIIMDGNGRWAQARSESRSFGHNAGLANAIKIITAGAKINLEYLTLYSFSSENWHRPENEIETLFNLARSFIGDYLDTLLDYDVKIRIIGSLSGLDQDIVELIARVHAATNDCQGLNLNIAFNYSGRSELVNALKSISRQVKNNLKQIEDIDEELVQAELFTSHVPDPDLIIRTGGEQRLSNFLLWQSAYSEFLFSPVMWPDFSDQLFLAAIADYSSRDRRFGRVKS